MDLTSYSTFPPRKEDGPHASSILENITDGFIALDREWRYVYVNAEAERLHGMSREEHLGKVMWDLFPGMLGTALYEKLHWAVSEGTPVELENYCEASDHWYRVKAYPRREGGLSIYFRDITAQRRAEAIQQQAQEALRESEARLNAIIGQATVGIAEEDLAGRFTLVNDYFCTMLGRTREEMLTLGVEDVTHPDDLRLTLEMLHHGIAQGKPYTMEKRWLRPDGSVVWVNNNVNVIAGADGEPSRVVLISVDITERKRVERELQSSEQWLRTMTDILPQLVWTCTPEGDCDYVSRQWREYTGLGEEETLGYRWLYRVLHREDRERTLEAWMRAVEGKADYDIEYRMRRHDGVYRWFKARATPLRNEHDEIVKWFGTSTDIDGQICTERELRRANQDLEQFAFSASHDLQEPLRMVSIFSQMLKKKYVGQLDTEADEFIEYVTRGASQMEMLLKDLLTYAQAASSVRDEHQELTNASAVMFKVRQALAAAIEQSGAVVYDGALPAVKMKEVYLFQLLQNLIGNAIKYRSTERPRIHVSAVREEYDWVFSVRDNGIGIDPKHHELVFGIFKRLHGQKYEGTGIGLAICQRIVERYGGRIWVESQLGEGATFHFTLPAEDGNACGNLNT